MNAKRKIHFYFFVFYVLLMCLLLLFYAQAEIEAREKQCKNVQNIKYKLEPNEV